VLQSISSVHERVVPPVVGAHIPLLNECPIDRATTMTVTQSIPPRVVTYAGYSHTSTTAEQGPPFPSLNRYIHEGDGPQSYNHYGRAGSFTYTGYNHSTVQASLVKFHLTQALLQFGQC
jgi:hypothetical protein